MAPIFNKKAPIFEILTKNGAKFEILKNGADYENFNKNDAKFDCFVQRNEYRRPN